MITLEEAKEHLRVDHEIEDDLIQVLIQAAYLHAEKKTRRSLIEREIDLVIDSLPQRDKPIEIQYAPVKEIISFDYISASGNPESIDPSMLRLDTRELYPKLMPQFGTVWPDVIAEPESITIGIKVGYTETPADIRQALLLMVGHLYEHRESVVIGAALSELPMGVDMLLGPHKIPRVA